MEIRKLIRENRNEIDRQIEACRNRHREHNPITPLQLSDSDRQAWILNEPALYQWAKSKGMRS